MIMGKKLKEFRPCIEKASMHFYPYISHFHPVNLVNKLTK